jgi:hypothetical protein
MPNGEVSRMVRRRRRPLTCSPIRRSRRSRASCLFPAGRARWPPLRRTSADRLTLLRVFVGRRLGLDGGRGGLGSDRAAGVADAAVRPVAHVDAEFRVRGGRDSGEARSSTSLFDGTPPRSPRSSAASRSRARRRATSSRAGRVRADDIDAQPRRARLLESRAQVALELHLVAGQHERAAGGRVLPVAAGVDRAERGAVPGRGRTAAVVDEPQRCLDAVLAPAALVPLDTLSRAVGRLPRRQSGN